MRHTERQLRQARQPIEARHFAFELLKTRTVFEQQQLTIRQIDPTDEHDGLAETDFTTARSGKVDASRFANPPQSIRFAIAGADRAIATQHHYPDGHRGEDGIAFGQRSLQGAVAGL